MKKPRIILLLMVALAIALGTAVSPWSGTARATTTVNVGIDLFETVPGTSFQQLDLPPDFFGPGCDPFSGVVDLEGVPLVFFDFGIGPVFGLGPTDTIVERLQPANAPFPATIDIEILALQLQSVSPITVTCGGATELWDVDVQLGPGPQSRGSMTIRHETLEGGTFDSFLPVQPLLIFKRPGTGAVIIFDPPSRLIFRRVGSGLARPILWMIHRGT